MTSWEQIQQEVERRAAQRCEYCRMHQALQGATFHVEHIVPQSRGGKSILGNLAWACPGCNLHKSNRLEFADPQTGQVVSLFNPRVEDWADHFEWKGYHISARTKVGRATIAALDMNHPRRFSIRSAEELFGLFPPEE
jgi:hypothetical protein